MLLLLSQTTAKTEEWVCQAGPFKVPSALMTLAMRSSGVVVEGGTTTTWKERKGRRWHHVMQHPWGYMTGMSDANGLMLVCYGLCHRWMPVLPLSQMLKEDWGVSTSLQLKDTSPCDLCFCNSWSIRGCFVLPSFWGKNKTHGASRSIKEKQQLYYQNPKTMKDHAILLPLKLTKSQGSGSCW